MKSNLALHKIEALAASLRAAKDSGALAPDDFRRVHESFRMTDLKGQEWSIGLKTFEWHRQDGGGWVKEPPPARLLIDTAILRQIQKLPRAAAPAAGPAQRTAPTGARASASSSSTQSTRRAAPRARPEPEPEPEPEPVDDSTCSKCGAEIEPDDKFCGECGAPRKKAAKPAPRRPRPAAREEEDDEPFASPPPRGRRPVAREEDDEEPYGEEEPLPAAGAEPPPAPSKGVGILSIFWCCLMAAVMGLAFDWWMYENGAFMDHHLKELAIIFGALTAVILALAGAFRLAGPGAGAVYNSAVLPLAYGALAFVMSAAAIQNVSTVASLVDDVRGPLDMRMAMIAAASLVAFVTLGFVLLIQRTFLMPLFATIAALGLGGYAVVLYFLESQNDKFVSDEKSPSNPSAIVQEAPGSISPLDGPAGKFVVITPNQEAAAEDGAMEVEVGIPGNDNDGLQVISIDKGVFEEAAKMGVPTPRPIGPAVVTRPKN